MILIKLAWRNIFRNKRRTLIAATAIGIGLAALIFVDALMIGMSENMVRNSHQLLPRRCTDSSVRIPRRTRGLINDSGTRRSDGGIGAGRHC